MFLKQSPQKCFWNNQIPKCLENIWAQERFRLESWVCTAKFTEVSLVPTLL
jgi:hypothetical protein